MKNWDKTVSHHETLQSLSCLLFSFLLHLSLQRFVLERKARVTKCRLREAHFSMLNDKMPSRRKTFIKELCTEKKTQKSGIFNLVDSFSTFIFNLNNHTFGLLEIYGPALEVPFRGLVAPASCTDDRANIRRNTVCSYGCESGHYIAGGDNSLVCQINGLWKGNVPCCKRKCLCYNLFTHGTMIYSSERQVI